MTVDLRLLFVPIAPILTAILCRVVGLISGGRRMTAAQIRPLDPQPPEGATYSRVYEYTKIHLVVFTNPPGRFKETGIPAPFTAAEIEGHEVRVMRLRDYYNSEKMNAAYLESGRDFDVYFDWVRKTLKGWSADHPDHPWDSNPWVCVMEGRA